MSKLRHNYERERDSFLKQMADLSVTVEFVTERREQITPEITLVDGKVVLSEALKAKIRSKRGRDKS